MKIASLLAFSLLLTAPCLAGTIDLTGTIKGMDGPFTDCAGYDEQSRQCNKWVPMTVRRMLAAAAARPVAGAAFPEQIAHGILAQRIMQAESSIDLTDDESVFLKSQLQKLEFNALAVAQVGMLLDPTLVKK